MSEPLTASTLHTLVADVPECVPENLRYVAHTEDWWYFHVVFPVQHAADLIAGNVKRMLGAYVLVYPDGSAEVNSQDTTTHCGGSSELEALLAAYRAGKKGNADA